MFRSEQLGIVPGKIIANTDAFVRVKLPTVDSDGETTLQTYVTRCDLQVGQQVNALVQRPERTPDTANLSHLVFALVSPTCGLCSSLNRCKVGLDPQRLTLTV